MHQSRKIQIQITLTQFNFPKKSIFLFIIKQISILLLQLNYYTAISVE